MNCRLGLECRFFEGWAIQLNLQESQIHSPTPTPTKQLEACSELQMTSSKETCYHTPWEKQSFLLHQVTSFEVAILRGLSKCPLESCWGGGVAPGCCLVKPFCAG